MQGLIYLYKTAAKNRILKALRRPVTYVYLVGGIAYITMIASFLVQWAGRIGADTPEGLVTGLSLLVLFLMPSSFATYAKRKGIVFKPGDIHFVFTSPASPKLVLWFTQIKQYLLGFILYLTVSIVGILFFHIVPWKMFLYFVFSFIVENILEGSLVILLYGNEKLSENTLRWLARSLWCILGLLVLFGAFLIFTKELSFQLITDFLGHPFLLCIPVIGWNLAAIRLLLLGPTVVNVICSAAYIAAALLLLVCARRMKCTGEYYEDAVKFSDDYMETVKRKKSGDVVGPGPKARYRKASVTYKGGYARAIFYRQLLEYKKNKYFIFNLYTLFAFLGGLGIGYYCYKTGTPGSIKGYYVIPGVGAYLTLIFSGYATKWSKEMKNPYTYLIPDQPVRKLWYATAIEHVRSLIDGCLLAVPGVIIMGFSPLTAVLYILIYACLQANKLYINILGEVLLGDVLGAFGKQIFQMLFQGIIMCIGIVVCVVVTALTGVQGGLLGLLIYVLIATGAIATGGSIAFQRMEVL